MKEVWQDEQKNMQKGKSYDIERLESIDKS